MNGRLNCVLEVCCRTADAKQALTDQIVEDLACDPNEARKHAEWIHENFDLAPKGTLGAFKAAIAKLAREAQRGLPSGASPGLSDDKD